MLTTYFSDILQNAPFRSQIFIIFFASVGKGALTPLTKILRMFPVRLSVPSIDSSNSGRGIGAERPAGRISVDCCGRHAAGAASSSKCGQWHVDSRRRRLNRDLSYRQHFCQNF